MAGGFAGGDSDGLKGWRAGAGWMNGPLEIVLWLEGAVTLGFPSVHDANALFSSAFDLRVPVRGSF